MKQNEGKSKYAQKKRERHYRVVCNGEQVYRGTFKQCFTFIVSKDNPLDYSIINAKVEFSLDK